MLISRKVTQDKRVLTDFRHQNVRIAKNNLAYPLLKDTFSVLGSYRCEVLSVLDLRHISLTKTIGKFKEILGYITIFWKCIMPISKNAYGTKHLTFDLAIIHKCYIKMYTE